MIIENMQYTKKVLNKLLNTPSPSGYCDNIMKVLEQEVEALGYQLDRTNKGNGVVSIEGTDSNQKALLLTAHVDTLGAMVRSIKSDGKLRFTSVGGYTMHSVEGEYCTVHTRSGKTIRGTILNTSPSVHASREARTQERKEEVMEIRLDEVVSSEEDVDALGIRVGDFISFDPRVEMTDSGYIKSRHLDDKAGVSCIMTLLKHLKEANVTLTKSLKVMFSTYEEVGHGSAHIPEDVDTILAIDMGVIGEDLKCTEQDVSICVKDSSGPYDYEMIGELIEIADEMDLDYSLDVYPHYNSDASAAMYGGNNVKAALIGPGIHGSHTMERTHEKGLLNATNLLIGYVTK